MIKKFILLASLSLFAIGGLLMAHYRASARSKPALAKTAEPVDHWRIKGALSEACTCNVPCTCNFGQGPSPHSYCYVVYAYGIKEGNFNGTKLDGLRFGATEGAKGTVMYLDASATGEQRKALEALARKVMKVNGGQIGHHQLLGVEYVDIKQEYDERHDSLDLGGAGRFKTDYIMGRDKSKPVVVVNNTEWAIHETIKGKTEYFSIKDKYGDQHSARGTNSNHGDFQYDENTQLGEISCSTSCATGLKANATHKH